MATKMSLKLLVDKSRNKVLFAESGKDVVDFLFSLLSLPVATIVRLLTGTQTTTGCISNLYSSIENLDNLYMQPDVHKSLLLQPSIGSSGNEMQMLFMQSDCEGHGELQGYEPMKPSYYSCIQYDNCGYFVTTVWGAKCGNFGEKMMCTVHFVEGQGSTGGEGGRGGYVKEVMTYMITDDLEVKPMSTISSVAVLKRFAVKDVDALEDRVVHLGRKEGLDLLRASLHSKSVLTDFFLKKGTKFSSPRAYTNATQ